MMVIFDYKQTAIEDEHGSFVYVLDAVARENAFYLLTFSLDEDSFDIRKVPFNTDWEKIWEVERELSFGDYRKIFKAIFYDEDVYYINKFYNEKLS